MVGNVGNGGCGMPPPGPKRRRVEPRTELKMPIIVSTVSLSPGVWENSFSPVTSEVDKFMRTAKDLTIRRMSFVELDDDDDDVVIVDIQGGPNKIPAVPNKTEPVTGQCNSVINFKPIVNHAQETPLTGVSDTYFMTPTPTHVNGPVSVENTNLVRAKMDFNTQIPILAAPTAPPQTNKAVSKTRKPGPLSKKRYPKKDVCSDPDETKSEIQTVEEIHQKGDNIKIIPFDDCAQLKLTIQKTKSKPEPTSHNCHKEDKIKNKKSEDETIPKDNITETQPQSSSENSQLNIQNDDDDDIIIVAEYHNENVSDETSSRSSQRNISAESNRLLADFVQLCLKFDSSDSMTGIMDSKIQKYFESASETYLNSPAFRNFIKQKMANINENPAVIFFYIREVIDELASQTLQSSPEMNKTEGDTTDKTTLNQRQIEILEKKLTVYNDTIKKFEEKEVDSEDDENSAYILADKYKAKLMVVYRKLCELKGTKQIMRSKRSKNILSKLELDETKIPRLANSIKRLAASKRYWFPNYREIFKCVKHCLKEAGNEMTESEIHSEARTVFIKVGNLLQKGRKMDELYSLCSLMDSKEDPAESDPALAEALNKNYEIGKRKEEEIIDKFVQVKSTKPKPANTKENFLKDEKKTATTSKIEVNRIKPISLKVSNECNKDTNATPQNSKSGECSDSDIEFIC